MPAAATTTDPHQAQAQFDLGDEPSNPQNAASTAAPHYSPQVWKHNRLVEARYQLNTRASKIFALSVAKLRGRKAASLSVEFTVEEFAQLCNVNKHALYGELYELTKSLMQNQPVISIPLPPEEAQKRSKRGKSDPFTHVMLWPKISYKGEGVIEVHFHEDLRPYLLELTREFTRYDLLNVMRLSSTHTIRLYELLKEQLYRSEWKVEYDDLKELLGIKPEQYPSMGNFRQRILVPAQKEIHKLTDVHFHYKLLKTGRKYTALRFYISSHPAPHQQAAAAEPAQEAANPVEVEAVTTSSVTVPKTPQKSAVVVVDYEALNKKYRTGTSDTDYHGRWDAQQLIQYFRKSVENRVTKEDLPENLLEVVSNRLHDFPALREGYFEVIDSLVSRKLALDLETFLREDVLVRVLDRQWDSLGEWRGTAGASEPAVSKVEIDAALVADVAAVLAENSPTTRQGQDALARLHPVVNQIFDAWDAACTWGTTKSRSQKRLDRFARHIVESETFREHWQTAIANASKSRFMRGENTRGQKFAINCLLNEEFLEKLVEGEFS